MSPEEVECPHCGYENDLTDLEIDDCLYAGRDEECVECKKRFVITEVDYSAYVYVEKA
jgi:DNA-directed RNA polymerase subunit RPC12/RpoP